MSSLRCAPAEFAAWKALGARNADGAAEDVYGQPIGVEEVFFDGSARVCGWPLFCVFGPDVVSLRLWHPGERTDGDFVSAIVECGRGAVVAYVFDDGRDQRNYRGADWTGGAARGRFVTQLDIVVWTQMCRVLDRVEPIALSCYGYVQRAAEDGVTIVRVSREDARDMLDPIRVSRRIAGRIVGNDLF